MGERNKNLQSGQSEELPDHCRRKTKMKKIKRNEIEMNCEQGQQTANSGSYFECAAHPSTETPDYLQRLRTLFKPGDRYSVGAIQQLIPGYDWNRVMPILKERGVLDIEHTLNGKNVYYFTEDLPCYRLGNSQ